MKTLPKMLASLLLVAALISPTSRRVHADIAPPEAPQGSSLLPGSSATQVRMMAETVTMVIEPDPADEQGAIAHTTASFSMRNLGSEAEHMQVRFPLDLVHWDSGRYAEIGDLRVRVNGRGVPTERRVMPYGSSDDPSLKDVEMPWGVFDVTFPPGEDISIEVSYTTQGYGYYPYEAFRYILETGAGWKDSIGSADIIVRLPYPANEQNVWQEAETGYSNPSATGAFSGNEIRWHFNALEPTWEDNIEVSLVAPRLWQRVLKEQKAVEANPNDGEAWGRLGKAYKEIIRMPKGYLRSDPIGLQLFELSREAYEKCLALLPDDSLWHAGYADLLWPHYYFDVYMSGKPEEAGLLPTILSELRTALELDPHNEVANNLLEEISYSISGAVLQTESGYEFLGLTATVAAPTPYTVDTPTATAIEPIPATATLGSAPATSTPEGSAQVSTTATPPDRVGNPLCGGVPLALPALGTILFLKRRMKKSPVK